MCVFFENKQKSDIQAFWQRQIKIVSNVRYTSNPQSNLDKLVDFSVQDILVTDNTVCMYFLQRILSIGFQNDEKAIEVFDENNLPPYVLQHSFGIDENINNLTCSFNLKDKEFQQKIEQSIFEFLDENCVIDHNLQNDEMIISNDVWDRFIQSSNLEIIKKKFEATFSKWINQNKVEKILKGNQNRANTYKLKFKN